MQSYLLFMAETYEMIDEIILRAALWKKGHIIPLRQPNVITIFVMVPKDILMIKLKIISL